MVGIFCFSTVVFKSYLKDWTAKTNAKNAPNVSLWFLVVLLQKLTTAETKSFSACGKCLYYPTPETLDVQQKSKDLENTTTLHPKRQGTDLVQYFKECTNTDLSHGCICPALAVEPPGGTDTVLRVSQQLCCAVSLLVSLFASPKYSNVFQNRAPPGWH